MITPEQLALHAAWLRGEPNGQQLVVRDADLRDANLSGAWLSGADLCDGNLRGADLSGANLSGAILQGADLSGAILQGADLSGAILQGADLCDADLRGAWLRGAWLRGAILRGADLSGANLSGAILQGADLSGADLSDAILQGAIGLAIATDAAQRLRAVAEAALASPTALKMSDWHQCNTTHCIAGWAVAQAGEPGRLLEAAMGPEVAGLMLLGIEAHSHFFDNNDTARAWLQEVLKR